MKVNSSVLLSKANVNFKAVRINHGIIKSKNANAIEQVKRQMEDYASQDNLQQYRDRKIEIERENDAQKEESLKTWYARLFQEGKITNEFVKKEALQKYQNNSEQEKALEETQKATDKMIELAKQLELELKANNELQAKRNEELKTLTIGEYRTSEGFSRIAGYDSEKEILYKYFISEIAKEKNGEEADIPSSILFFGPKGNGKTTFAQAFAEEIGCEKPIAVRGGGMNTTAICNKFYKNLMKTAEELKEKFEQTGKRQIIFLDEFDVVANKKSTILPELEEFFKTCYEKYHCIVFATTNYPLALALDLTDDGAFSFIVSQDPPNKENKIEILKYYLQDKLKDEITNEDYETLADLLEEREIQEQGKYSISQIRYEICEANEDNLLTLDKVKQNIQEKGPNIEGEKLEDYYKAMNTIMKNEVQE